MYLNQRKQFIDIVKATIIQANEGIASGKLIKK